MIVYVTIISVEVGVIVEVVQPRGPPNVLAPDAILHCSFSHNARKLCVTAVIIKYTGIFSSTLKVL